MILSSYFLETSYESILQMKFEKGQMIDSFHPDNLTYILLIQNAINLPCEYLDRTMQAVNAVLDLKYSRYCHIG